MTKIAFLGKIIYFTDEDRKMIVFVGLGDLKSENSSLTLEAARISSKSS